MQLIQKFLNHQHWVLCLYCDGVEMPEIHAKPVRPVLLLDKEYRRGEGALTRLHNAGVEHCSDLALNLILYSRGVTIGANVDRSSTRYQWNIMGKSTLRGITLKWLKHRLKLLQKLSYSGWLIGCSRISAVISYSSHLYDRAGR